MSKSNVVNIEEAAGKKGPRKNRVEEIVGVTIAAPKFDVLTCEIVGTAPYVQHRFYKKAELMAGMEQGDVEKKKRSKNRKGRKYDQEFKDSQYFMKGGHNGIPAAAFRNAMISACRIIDFKMTQAKQCIFIEADGIDERDGIPLVRLYGKPARFDAAVRNANGGADVRTRAMWREWTVALRIRYDALLFTREDVSNLLLRAGISVGVGEGRPASKNSAGMGWGTFDIVSKKRAKRK